MSADLLQPYYNIPQELRDLPQWVCWRYEDIGALKPTKVPYQVTGEMANVTDSNTWATFDIVIKNRFNFSGIGFVFNDSDGYTFIDLDDPSGDPANLERQLKIFKEFDSYAERSPSKTGLHIIIKGKVPQGRRRSKIEVYSSARYATMTGDVYNNSPIREYQDKLTMLYDQMGSGSPKTIQYNGNAVQTIDDKGIIDTATGAINGDKFLLLYKGHWQDLYQSQSEADLAFINIIAFYTQNETQITRIFRQSPLGARPKAKRNDYVNWMIRKSFDQMLPPIDIDGFKVAMERFNGHTSGNGSSIFELRVSNDAASNLHNSSITKEIGSVAQRLVPAAHNGLDVGSSPAATTIQSSIPLPPGLMGEIAQFIYQAAPKPIPEVAIAGAIGLMGGICGKAYNISGTGLNQYVILVANTGSGKEAIASGIDKLMASVKLQVPTSEGFLGPAEIASGQALIRYLNNHSCFVSILGEFGIRLQSISDPRANGPEKMLKRILLDLYNKSGHHQVFRPNIYADKDKDIGATKAPNFNILAETTPETFYQVLTEEMVSAGLLPRFLIIEYKGKVPYLNKGAHKIEPSFQLVERFASLAAQCEMIMHSNRVIDIETHPEAAKMLDSLENSSTDRINDVDVDFKKQLWNRVHMKVLRVSALVAVGVNLADPLILPEYVVWAKNLVLNDVRIMESRFEQGEIGAQTGELKQLEEMKRMIKLYYSDADTARKYKIPQKMYDDKILVGQYLNRRLVAQAAFKNDKMGSTIAIKRCIQTLVDSDTIREVGKLELGQKYGTTQKSYVLKDLGLLV